MRHKRISARRIRNAWVVLGALAVGGGVGAQDTARSPSPVYVGSEGENYLRYLQSLGDVPLHQWSMRGFSDADLKALLARSGGDVWTAWPTSSGRRLGSKWKGVEILPANVGAIYNTLFPYGMNDGATWAGRGLTLELRGGVTAKWGPVRTTIAPTAFWSENRAFALMPARDTSRPFSDPNAEGAVDLPQRFGTTAYGRIDPGQSGIRIEGLGGQAGFSWENRWWGPMSEFPYILGTNAAGFPHAFIGTASPRNVWAGRLSALILYGRVDQTLYSPMDSGNSHRFVSGAMLVFQPRPFPGLEIGFARFFHVTWPDSGLNVEYFTHLFETLNKSRIGKVFALAGNPAERISGDNQLASAFARLVLPRSGVEVYAEFGREDHNWDKRDMIVELDHTAGIGFGIRKVWRAAEGLRAIRFESTNHQENTLLRHRGQGGAYVHVFARQGHTQLGQLMGTGAAAGNGAATTLKYERFRVGTAASISWTRLVNLDRGLSGSDGQHVARYEQSRRAGSTEMRWAASTVLDMNRNLRGREVLSLRLEAGWTRF